ncbi:hypothetical protein M6D81_31500 [Paenibacillus sp. J5C_2022]|uniref:hypothetical protein n=1 Tax=Paenibacillus sp. J5C2022 TaxID=2977129 RepID=UPI0021D241E4|nr:hypothetical protein [Paenibacillus sp. J5C2022]MCU6713233.1 hypothetical protein [Paenibacillus sp. J5C2022]
MISRMKIPLLLSIIILIIVLVLIIISLNQNPIKVNGITQEDNGKTLILEVINKGISNVELIDVFVNDNKNPVKVELGVSYTAHLVGGSGLDEDPNIKFLEINKEKISPDLSPNEKKLKMNKKDSPIHFGIRINEIEPIDKVIVKYKYFGLKYTKSFIVEEWPESNF